MLVKLQDLKCIVWHERQHLALGHGVAVNLPPWLVDYIKNDKTVWNLAADYVINNLVRR